MIYPYHIPLFYAKSRIDWNHGGNCSDNHYCPSVIHSRFVHGTCTVHLYENSVSISQGNHVHQLNKLISIRREQNPHNPRLGYHPNAITWTNLEPFFSVLFLCCRHRVWFPLELIHTGGPFVPWKVAFSLLSLHLGGSHSRYLYPLTAPFPCKACLLAYTPYTCMRIEGLGPSVPAYNLTLREVATPLLASYSYGICTAG